MTARWGLLIYACAANELDPEISSAVDRFITGYRGNIPAALQVGRASPDLVQALRPSLTRMTFKNRPLLKRYTVGGREGAVWAAELPPANMASPATLADFLVWGIKALRTEHCAAVLSGHGAGFLGALADYSCGFPMLMSLPGLAKSLFKAQRATGKKISVLITDACYMNTVEAAYELSLRGAAEFLVAPAGTVPLQGCDYAGLAGVLENCRESRAGPLGAAAGTAGFLKAAGGDSFAAVRLCAKRFAALKKLTSQLACRLVELQIKPEQLNCSGEPAVNIRDFWASASRFLEDGPSLTGARRAGELLWEILPCGGSTNIFCPPCRDYFYAASSCYQKLLFAQNNWWTAWLAGTEHKTPARPLSSSEDLFQPQPLPLSLLAEFLLSLEPGMTLEEIKRAFKKLGWLN